MVIALLPVVSYSIAFAFETGYYEHFDIPISLIEISVSNIVYAFLSLALSLLIFYVVLEAINPIWCKISEKIRPRLYLYLYFLFGIITHLIIAKGEYADIKIILYILAFLIFTDFILPALDFKNKVSYVDRIVSIHKKELEYYSAMDKLAYSIGFNWFRLAMTLFVLIFLAYSTGLGKARVKIEYQVLASKPNVALLKITPKYLILSEYDSYKKETFGEIIVKELNSFKNLTIKKKQIGPLKLPKKMPQSNKKLSPESSATAPTPAS